MDELKLFDKLENCSEIQADDIKRGDHFLYTSTKFKEDGRKCVYAVCYGASKGKLTCNSYVPKGEEKALEDWVVTITDKYKQYRFYKRNDEDKKSIREVELKLLKKLKPKVIKKIEVEEHEVEEPKPLKKLKPKVIKKIEVEEHGEEDTDYKGPYPPEEVFKKLKKKI
jgi:hypothetical protein